MLPCPSPGWAPTHEVGDLGESRGAPFTICQSPYSCPGAGKGKASAPPARLFFSPGSLPSIRPPTHSKLLSSTFQVSLSLEASLVVHLPGLSLSLSPLVLHPQGQITDKNVNFSTRKQTHLENKSPKPTSNQHPSPVLSFFSLPSLYRFCIPCPHPPPPSHHLNCNNDRPHMSLTCGVECVVCLGCTRWAWKRCTYVGSYDSETWAPADPADFEPVPRVCRCILAVYEDDLANPKSPPPGGYRLNPSWVVKRVTYEETGGHSPPYLIYTDHDAREIIVAVRGLNLAKESDYALLLDNRLGMQMFNGGYVHHGLLKSAIWLLNRESETLASLWKGCGPDYKMVFAGHSLGSGVAALMAVVVVNHRDMLGGIPRSQVRCYAVAPARCMSLNLAVKYADVIHSVVLQDDFLPRTPTPLEDIFESIFCLPCLMFLICLRDTFIPEGRKLRDPRRLYAPGRMFHIVERKFCRCGRFPPEVRSAIPVEGRFEHIVLSCNTTSDHAILWIERESERALEIMKERMAVTAPPKQRMERQETLAKEHMDALQRAVTLNIPHAVSPAEESVDEADAPTPATDQGATTSSGASRSTGRPNWSELVERLFNRNDSGALALKRDIKNVVAS